MYQNKKIGVIIAAAGSGSRMGGGISKQFRKIDGMPVLSMAVAAFEDHPWIDEITVVTRADSLDLCRREMIAPYGFRKVNRIVEGGEQRQDSVYRGLLALPEDTALVLVHDGARPFVSRRIISDSVEAAFCRGAAVAAVPVKDTIKTAEHVSEGEGGGPEDSYFTGTPDRGKLYAVQTPQAFSVPILREALERAFEEKFYGTDDSVLVERLGKTVYLVKGEYENIKITTAGDMETGAAIARGMKRAAGPEKTERAEEIAVKETLTLRVGTGFDVHRLQEGRKLILGGVEIPWEKGLLGHSDADVLIHAVMDALLGAAALGDIGQHFPDTDQAYRGISSLELLKRVGELLRGKGYGAGNIDAVVIAQQPKIAPFIPSMREKIAGALAVSPEQVSVKATTTEGLGFCGQGEGIAAQAAATVVPSAALYSDRQAGGDR